MNRFKPLFLDIHALQMVPPSCVNRDDTGSPKTAYFGGARRARVSSQSWKKAMRDEFSHILDEDDLGQRTKRAVDLIAGMIQEKCSDVDEAAAAKKAEEVLKATGVKVNKGDTGYLLFVGRKQADALAQLAVDSLTSGEKIVAKEAKAIFNVKERPALNAVDIALFGRMVADAPDLNVDAAVQVAHAISVDAVETEYDYYTALDDRTPDDESGAGMIGTTEYLSATFYRYATVDVYHLYENLGSVKAARRAVEAFLRAYACSMPTGKQNSFANRTLPAALVVQQRDTQPVSLVNAFERPVSAWGNKGQVELACERLVEQERMLDEAFGVAPAKTDVVCAAPGTEVLAKLCEKPESLEAVIAATGAAVEAYLLDRGASADGQE